MTLGRIHFYFLLVSYPLLVRLHANKVHVIVGASKPIAYWRETPARASTLLESVVRTLRGEKALPQIFCPVASSLGHLRSQCSIVCGSSLQSGRSGFVEGSRTLAYAFSRGV